MSTLLVTKQPGNSNTESVENVTIQNAVSKFVLITEELSGKTTSKNAKLAAILYGALCTKEKYRLKHDDVKIYTASIAISAVIQGIDEVAENIVNDRRKIAPDKQVIFEQLLKNTPQVLENQRIPPVVTAAICNGTNVAFFRDMYDAMLLEERHFDPDITFATYLDTATSSNGLHVVSRVLYLLFGEAPPDNYNLCGIKGGVRLTNESLRICMDIIKRKGDLADGSPNVVAKYMQQNSVSESIARKQLQYRSDENLAEAAAQAEKTGDQVLMYVISLAKMVSAIAKTGFTL